MIVDSENSSAHIGHDILGEFFNIKKNKKKIMPGVISKKLINKEKEKLNIIKFNKRDDLRKKQKRLAQERFEKQVPDGTVIVNLLEMNI